MTAILLPSGKLRYHAYIAGVYGPAVGYKLYTYEAGTTTPKATYADADGAVALSNPIILDSNGECAPYGSGSYKLVFTDPDGATVWTQDDVLLSNSAVDEEWCGTAGGTADALTLTPGVAIAAYETGQRFSFVAASANTTAVTVAVGGLAAKALTKNGNTALEANDLVTGRIYQMQYDGTRFQLLTDPLATLRVTAPATSDDSSRVVTSGWVKDLTASETQAGIVELATDTEAKTGTDTARAITPANLKAAQIIQLTSQTASSTEVNFTGIPAYAKRVTVLFRQLSTSGSSDLLVRLGSSGGIEATGYTGVTSSAVSASASIATWNTGCLIRSVTTSGGAYSGAMTFTKLTTTDSWIVSGTGCDEGAATMQYGGFKTLSGALDRVRITTVGGTDSFDAGTLNVIYE